MITLHPLPHLGQLTPLPRHILLPQIHHFMLKSRLLKPQLSQLINQFVFFPLTFPLYRGNFELNEFFYFEIMVL